jgi:hypothetical protein
VLRISVAETAGEHPASDEETEEEAEELTLDAFEEEFLEPEGRAADITVSVEDGRSKARFDRWLRRISRAQLQPAGEAARRTAPRRA